MVPRSSQLPKFKNIPSNNVWDPIVMKSFRYSILIIPYLRDFGRSGFSVSIDRCLAR